MVNFDFSCKYDIGTDQSDWNKLFGVGYLPTHHRNSARFVWRYNPDNNMIDVGWYCYVKGERYSGFLCSIPFHRNHLLQLNIENNLFVFTVYNPQNIQIASHAVPYWKISKLSYRLGGYFGGNRKAPHSMNYTMKEV